MNAGTDDHSPQQPFNWACHPARERFGSAILGMAIIAAMASVIWIEFGWAWAIGAIALLLISLNRFFLPSHFIIDEQGISAKYPLRRQRMRWDDARRFICDRHGGYLSTRSRRSWTDAYRGMHLLFGTQRHAVIERIQRQIAAAKEPIDNADAASNSDRAPIASRPSRAAGASA